MSNNAGSDVPGFAVAILAAGKGTRLKSRHPKVLHRIAGKPLLEHVIAAATNVVSPSDIFAIVGHEAHRVEEAVARTGVNFILQAEQRGTGHAIMTARQALARYDHFLVLSGDVPLIRPETIQRLRDFHTKSGAAMTILTAEVDDPSGYGRMIRHREGGAVTDQVDAIVEHKSAGPEQLAVREINSGIYAFASGPLFAHLDEVNTDNAHGEFYLTDMAAILNRAGERVVALRAEDAAEISGVNTRVELAELDALLRRRKAEELMAAGVTIFRPETCIIDAGVTVGPDTVIEPFAQLLGSSRVGSDCHISSFSVITDCELGDGITVRPGCILTESKVEAGAMLGPYSHLRPGAEIGAGAHVGNFVELKKTRLGKGSKANHLSYLGDAVIGEQVNVGAGTITCNYDGVQKHQTTIEDGAFIGSDTVLVAPVKIGRGAYVGAASCVTADVPADALGVGRARQINKEGWARKRREQQAKSSDKAAGKK
jgi:bifunctional UDP-N-acetylglucosamine pyrophosphorylase/glucosamine-1-phosphate N-acetyltransferase